MGGGDLNLKKSWHPQTMKNIERVWKAEQKHEAECKKIEELQKELKDERAREEMTRYAEESGAIKKKDDRLDWMYQGPAGQVSRDEYLLGRPIDKQITDQYADVESGPGSTVSREASDKEKAKGLPTFKDNDFLNEGHKLQIGDDNKKLFLDKLKRDVEFLATLKIMDYSLLVGIHDVDRAEQEEMDVEAVGEEEEYEADGTGALSGSFGTPPDSPGNPLNCGGFFGPGEFDASVDVYAIKSKDGAVKKEVYFMAIIDILTHYDAKKKAAHAAKTVKHGAGAEISTVNPEQYSKRFYEFMSNILS
uniref:PIPK domain-containing protein n=1 Tax=Knipowitschia caucasica TaxID=637954 RepID=A0AAV2LM56_KNICA